MEQSNKISEYLRTVCDQIRWKKDHDLISEEIENHIIDQRNDFISKGLDEETATNKAILEMGDPIIVGTGMDSIYRPKVEWGTIALTGTLLLLGTIIRSFITYDYQMPWKFTNGIVYTLIGIVVMVPAYCLDFSIIGKYPRRIYFGLIAIAFMSMFISPVIRGQRPYIRYIMLLFPTAFAGIIYDMRNKGYQGIILSGIYFVIPAIICLKIPSLSSFALYSITCFVILTFAIVKGWFNVKKLNALLLVYTPQIILILSRLIFMNKYYKYHLVSQINRFKIIFNPHLDSVGSGYMGVITRKIIANAKLIGQNRYGIDTDGLLTLVDTDYLLTFLIDRVGWISFILIMLVILVFIIRSIKLSLGQKAVLGRLVSISVIATFSIQLVFYVMNNLGFGLFDPFILPLISYGGIGTIINMFLIGIMLSVYKSSALYRNDDKLLSKSDGNKVFQFVYGKIIIDLKR